MGVLYEISKNYYEALNIYNKLLQINDNDVEVMHRKMSIER